ncbi:hypothetical protein BJ322DRAFT_428820 [Thelephora terrestris]|uniref:Protein kinase domain-containing protein n=1 Tax=Thelephora terrestris TaxID=56493 RepID=A0A9P6HNQ2_9AGAM|nr:hypothetical protein BJ322DRAFT_428820 [Thelephora terrestris]
MIEGYKTEIQDILDDLDRPSLPFNGDKPVRSGVTQQLYMHSVGGATSVSEPGAFERLIRRKFAPHELPSLIEEILMCKDVVDMIRYLPRDDAQTFIDVINEALDMPDLSPWAQNQCLRPLYRTCGRHALLPKAMEIPACYDPTGNALYKGGYADVWKGQYRGKDVAVKVIRIFSNSDLGKVIGVSR